VKALSLWQPWASAIALGHKLIETRSWSTRYRGPLLIHAAKTFPKEARDFAAVERGFGRMPERVPLGAIVCVAELYSVRPTEEIALISALEKRYGDYTWGRFAWMLRNVQAFSEPIGYRGAQGLFEVPDSIIKEVVQCQSLLIPLKN
jgi:hypothetical protein